MNSLRSYLIVVIFTIGNLQVGICQDKPGGPSESAPTTAELNTELKVFKDSLLGQGSVDAATVMLVHVDPNARFVLLDALKQSENSPARIAVCKALIWAREQKKTITNDQDFIEPLLDVFASENVAEADSAVKATLMFEYEKIAPFLEKLVKDSSKAFKARVNAIHALKLRRDMKATIRLIELIDETAEADQKVSAEAKKALSQLGIAAGETPEARRQKIEEIQRAGEGAFLRAQLARQQAQVRQASEELGRWQKRYLSELEKSYKRLSDDKAKSSFLVEYLGDKESVVRLWALDKAYKWRLVSQLPDAFGQPLIGLISDENRNIRLNTAELLALMQRLNSAQSLLDQHQVEPDDEVRTKLFVALGAACSTAITGPPADIPVKMRKIRSTTLELAVEQYLFSEDDEKARNAAEVIRKLLVRDGLKSGDVDKYLNLLSRRYQDEIGKPNGALRGVLLNAMASLCAPESACRAMAKSLFESEFKEALQDKTDFVREAAVKGLAHINTKKALEMLRAGFFDDPSEAIRKKLIALVDQEGDEQDLNHLAEKIGKNSEGELAWQAMLNIFKRFNESKTVIWKEWVGKLTFESGGYSNDQRIAFFKIAEAKAAAEIKLEARKTLGDLYYKTGQFENAAVYFNILYEAAPNSKDKNAVFEKLLDASLKGLQFERVAGFMGNHLSEADLDPNGVIVRLLNDYLGQPPLGANQREVLKTLEEITVSQDRPNWRQWLNGWKTTLSKDEEEKIDKPNPSKS